MSSLPGRLLKCNPSVTVNRQEEVSADFDKTFSLNKKERMKKKNTTAGSFETEN